MSPARRFSISISVRIVDIAPSGCKAKPGDSSLSSRLAPF
jgi:hypothetical protein